MSQTSRLLAVPLIVFLATNVHLMADDGVKAGKATKNPKDLLSTATLVTQPMADAAMDLPCPNLQFSGVHPLTDFLEVLEAHWGKHLPYDLPFFADLPELDLEGIASLEEVEIQDIKIAAGTHTCRDALNLIFLQTTDPAITFQAAAGHIFVTTLAKAESEENLLSRVYNLSEFIGDNASARAHRPAGAKKGRKKDKSAAKQTDSTDSPQKLLKQFGGGGGGGFGGGGVDLSHSSNAAADGRLSIGTMVQLLQEQTSPPARWRMIDGEGGETSILGQYLVVRQTPAVHRQIEDILNQLRAAIKTGGAPVVQPGPATPVQLGGFGSGTSDGGGFGGGGQAGGGGGGGFGGGGGAGFF